MDKIPQICLGCGAPLHGPICEMCGREYDLNNKIRFNGQITQEDREVIIEIFGQKVRAYLTEFGAEASPCYVDTLGDRYGRVITSTPTITLTFEGTVI